MKEPGGKVRGAIITGEIPLQLSSVEFYDSRLSLGIFGSERKFTKLGSISTQSATYRDSYDW